MANTKVTSRVLADDAVLTANITDANVTTAKIATDAITGAKIADDAINSEHYTDGSIDTAHIADDQVTLAKMAGLARGKIIYGDSSGNPAALALGSNGQVLKSDGTDIAWGTDNSGVALDDISTGDAATTLATSAGNITIDAQGSDTDIIFKGTDGSTDTTFLTLDGSEAGWGSFNTGITLKNGMYINNADGSATSGYLYNDSDDFVIRSYTQDKDIIFKGNDGGSVITPMTIDMSAGGNVGIGTNAPTDYNSAAENLVVASSGDTGISIVAGTSNDSTLMFADGTGGTAGYRGRVAYDHATDAMNFHTSAAQHMRIQSDGIVVISSGYETFVPTIKHSGAVGNLSKLRVINRSGQSSDKGGLIELGGVTDDGVSRSDVFGAIAGLKNNASSGNREGYLQFSTNDGDSLDEYMRLTSGGILCVGDTTGYSGGHDAVSRMQLSGGGSVLGIRQTQVTDASHRVVQVFTDNGGTYRGRITINNSSCLFTSASDYRLKENIETLPNGLDRLKQLKPVKFKWKEHDYTSEGFIAHEVAEIVPEAVVGEKDDAVMQSMDYGRITPLLVKAIQEQQTIIDDLKARIETLEG